MGPLGEAAVAASGAGLGDRLGVLLLLGVLPLPPVVVVVAVVVVVLPLSLLRSSLREWPSRGMVIGLDWEYSDLWRVKDSVF